MALWVMLAIVYVIVTIWLVRHVMRADDEEQERKRESLRRIQSKAQEEREKKWQK